MAAVAHAPGMNCENMMTFLEWIHSSLLQPCAGAPDRIAHRAAGSSAARERDAHGMRAPADARAAQAHAASRSRWRAQAVRTRPASRMPKRSGRRGRKCRQADPGGARRCREASGRTAPSSASCPRGVSCEAGARVTATRVSPVKPEAPQRTSAGAATRSLRTRWMRKCLDSLSAAMMARRRASCASRCRSSTRPRLRDWSAASTRAPGRRPAMACRPHRPA